jgi:hypothetical protein
MPLVVSENVRERLNMQWVLRCICSPSGSKGFKGAYCTRYAGDAVQHRRRRRQRRRKGDRMAVDQYPLADGASGAAPQEAGGLSGDIGGQHTTGEGGGGSTTPVAG